MLLIFFSIYAYLAWKKFWALAFAVVLIATFYEFYFERKKVGVVTQPTVLMGLFFLIISASDWLLEHTIWPQLSDSVNTLGMGAIFFWFSKLNSQQFIMWPATQTAILKNPNIINVLPRVFARMGLFFILVGSVWLLFSIRRV